MKPNVPVSGYETCGGLVYLPRLLSKIRLHQAGLLDPAYHENLGTGFDGRLCRFLGVAYADVVERVRAGATDEEILTWARAVGRPRDEEDYLYFSAFLSKRGWRDEASDLVAERTAEYGLSTDGSIQCMFDVHDADEGRPPRFPAQPRA